MITLPGVVIQRKIYESSASLVYRGIRVQDNCATARSALPEAIVLKLLKQDYPSPQELTRYKQEYAITRSLNLEGVIKAYSQQDYQRTLVMLLEDFGGESLEYWTRQQPDFCPMPLSAFLRLAIDLTNILGKIHAANVIHKDINPSNIVLNPDTGVVKIIDFGIATQFNRTNPTFKSPHTLEGTLAYLSPEQTGRMNRSIDYRTDFYSLGVTFYQLLTGQLPFPTTDILELVHCHIAKSPVPPHEVGGVGCGVWGVGMDGSSSTKHIIPKAVSDIVMKLMAKNAEDRYQSAWGIKADLERCADQLEASSQINHIQLGLQDISDQFQIPQKLYGREAEIAALLTAFDRVAAGNDAERGRHGDVESHTILTPHTPHPTPSHSEMMLVSGYSGIGKSALVQELFKPITAKRGYFISGKFDQLQRNVPYSAIVDALRKLVQQLLSEPDEQVQQWRSRLLTALGSNGQLIIDVIPEVELIVGKQQPVPEVGATEAQNRFNLVFQKFIRACCSDEHPLVIFLDDLQWVDSATLKLIELILSDPAMQFLLLIGAYRDNEVTQIHPLLSTIEKLKQENVAINQITLAPLELEAVAQLIVETLHTSTESISPLAELIWRKTNGNPYFTNEFLKTLYSEDLIAFNNNQQCWQWNIAHIQAENITDNVVELVIGKLRQLPEQTQRVLRLAACVGAEFDLATLSAICKRSAVEIFAELTTAIQSELILTISELDENLLIQNYRFSHDRVQQAAYALIDQSQKQVVHLQIGRNLLEKTSPEQLSDRLFAIVDHLNYGVEQITTQLEQTEIAKLNLMVGQKAKAATAYEAALKYFNTGLKLLDLESWQSEYDLTLTLYSEAAEVAYLCGDFIAMEHLACVVHSNAKTVFDEVKVYDIKIQATASQGNLKQAIKIGLTVLARLGVSLPEEPTQLDIQLELEKTASQLASQEIIDLINLKAMSQPEPLAAMHILSSITSLTFIAAPNLFPLISLSEVNLSIAYGTTTWSAHGYVVYGIVLCGIVQEIETGYKFGKLALGLAEQLNIKEVKAKILSTFAASVMHWKEHLKESLAIFLESYQSAMETGSFEYVGYCGFHISEHLYFIGRELTSLEREIAAYSQIVSQVRRESPLNWIAILWQSVLNLLDRPKNPSYLMGDVYNEERSLPRAIEVNDISELVFCYLNKLILDYLFGNYFQAIKNAMLAEQYLSGIPGRVAVAIYYFYDSLAHLARFTEASTIEQETWLIRVNTSQARMRIWADHAPTNFQHKYDLVEAEKARVLGQWFEAEERYERAIQGAKDNEYIQEEALAYELAAKFYLIRGREKIAQTYMKEAHYCYVRWGAMAKVEDLETRYPQLFPESSNVVSTPVRATTGTLLSTSHTALDLATVMKAAQAISSEIELERLLSSLMQILIENAGAQTGCLLLKNSGEWAIEATCELNEGDQVCATQILQSIPMKNRLPESIVQYVIRTHEFVILNDVIRESKFINDPYIQQNQAQSLLCLPLLNQGKLVGVLYLENQLAAGAFTPERSQVLNLLSTQAAIAIENAKLYSKLRASESQMAQFLEAIPVGIGIIDAAGRPYYANQQGIQLLGKGVDPSVPPDQLSEAYQFYVTETDQIYPTERLPIIRALSGERTTVDDIDIHQNNAIIPVEAWGTPVFDEQGNVVYAIVAFQDITERKQAEKLLAEYNQTLEQQVAERTLALEQEQAALRQSEATNRAMISAVPDLLIQMSQNGTYLKVVRSSNFQSVNSQHLRVGANVHHILPPEIAQMRMEYAQRALQTGELQVYEQQIVSDDQVYDQEVRIVPSGNDQVLVMVRNISDRKRAEEASILEERNRMAREIHDTLAQAFTGVLVHMGTISQLVITKPEAVQTHIKIVRELARNGLIEARRSVAALRPQSLEDGNLGTALEQFVFTMQSSTEARLTCEVIGTPYILPADTENNLLRIGQEAFTNAIKYAQANEIQIELVYEPTSCCLRIKDNGRGFEASPTTLSRGFGLLGMTERSEHIGAQLSIESQLGQGTEVIVSVQREATT